MPGVRLFTDLKIWQNSRIWSKVIFQETQHDAFRRDDKLVIQINDSSESVMSNIAEGFGRGTQAEFVAFLGYAIGSLNETQSHLCAAYDREYLNRVRFAELFAQSTEIRKMIVGFIQSMVMPRSGVKNMRKVPNWSEQVWEIYERVTGKPRPEMFRTRAPETGNDAR
jgi:four helix bundle protein